jgi:hypothetical protein
MMIWFKRGLLCIGLLALVLFGLLYFWSVSILEALIQPHLEALGGELEIESIRLNLDGIELRVERYEDAELVASGLIMSYPWSQLGSMRSGIGGSVFVEEIQLRLISESGEATKAEALSLAARVAAITAQMDALPLSSLDVEVSALLIELPEQVLRYGVESTLLSGARGETYLAATFQDGNIELDVRVRVSEGGAGLALDFVAAAGSWEGFQKIYLEALSDPLATNRAEFYMNPLGEGRGFLDVSGYARWDAEVPDALSFTVLADMGESEIYFSGGELILQRTSVGLTRDGMGHERAYGKGAIDTVRFGSWMQSGGDWAVRADGAQLAAELRVGDALSLSLGHDDWKQLIEGSGQARFYLETNGVNVGLLRVLEVEQLPDDWTLDMALEVEGEGAFEDWQAADVAVQLHAKVVSVSAASKGLSAVNLNVESSLLNSAEGLQPTSLNLSVETLDLLEFLRMIQCDELEF